MDKLPHPNLSDHLRQSQPPKSPPALDQRILDYSKKHAPKKPRARLPKWVPLTATWSIMVIAILLTMQPSIVPNHEKLPQSVLTDYPADDLPITNHESDDELQILEESSLPPLPEENSVANTAKQINPIKELKTRPKRKQAVQDTPMSISVTDSTADIATDHLAKKPHMPVTAENRGMKSGESEKSNLSSTMQSSQSQPMATQADQFSIIGNHKRALTDDDGDLIPNFWELRYRLNPYDKNDAGSDPDKDGLSNLKEYQLKTDPTIADTDRDLIPDGWENAHGSDPLLKDAQKDVNKDGQSNLQEYQQSLKSQ